MLPKIQQPIFTLFLPISKKTVRYRPMLVKEEKMLLVAKESKDVNDIVNNIAQVVQNCLLEDTIDVENIPMVEFEYIFINIRSRSIGNTIELKYYDTYDRGIQHDVVIDIDDIKIDIGKKFNNKIMIDDNIGITMKVPTLNMARSIKNIDNMTNVGLDFICESIDYIFDKEQVYKANDYSREELLDFIESLPSKGFEKIEKFFDSLPTLKYSTSYKNSKGEDVNITLTRLEDFF